ncbi:pectinesterase [Trifolium repens]|nr:pectinesterase [Trifolium repens]
MDNLDLMLREAETNRLNISVSQSGDADFKTITEAINSIRKPNSRRVIISIAPGLYREKLLIPSTLPFITFLGNTVNKPKITGNAKASDIGSDGKPLKTYNTATVGVDAAYFIAMNIIFENTASPRKGSSNDQAVALRLSGDKCAVYNSEVYGFQDTLYDHKGLHYFKNCKIQGTVDFIFGDGKSLYEGCTINSIAQNSGFVTAQKREGLNADTGFSILNSKVVGSGQAYLGRAWGNYSRVIFSYTYMGNLVLPEGWVDSMGDQHHHNLTVFYAEYKCSGPGSSFARRPSWIRRLSDKDAQEFIGVQFIHGDTWLSPP